MIALRFDGEVALVTGGGRGMGRADCLALAERGAAVAVVDVDGDAADAVVAEIRASGGEATAATVSADPAAPADVVARVVATFGRLDVIVNNAGVAHSAEVAGTTDDDLERLLDVHLRLPVRLVRAGWDEVVRRRGRIVNVVSNAALFGKAGMSAYAASKGALLAWTRALALEAATEGVRVNAVAPIAATRLTDGVLGDLAERLDPSRVAPVVVWLAHRDCAANGDVVSVAGGAVAHVAAVRAPLGIAATPEGVRALLDAPCPTRGTATPTSAADELALVRDELLRESIT